MDLEKYKAELVYWEQNGEIRTAKKTWQQISQPLREGDLCSIWREGESPYGHWSATLFITAEGVYIIKEWVPAPGYTWQEIQVYKLNFA